jgi:alkylhydroperoxidase/carboxymuconolactone decarboxylase family protein YurZ
VLVCLQTLPELKSHTAAALNVGVEPIQIREAVYQLAPFIGFPRTLNAVATINEVFQNQGIELPLPAQGTVSDADRYSKGLAEQAPLYGDEIKDNLADLPEPFDEALPRFLTEFGFGDFYTRTGLTLAERELLVLCALATIGDTSPQLGPTAVRASRWATPRLPSSQHWCTASPTPGSRAPSLPYARSRTFSTNTAVLLVNLLDDLAADQPTPVDCAGQPGGATHRSCACQAHLIRQRSVVQVHLGPP